MAGNRQSNEIKNIAMENGVCSIIPSVTMKKGGQEISMDLGTRLLKDRIITLNGEVNDLTAEIITDELLILESEDPKAPITMFINSPGGSVTAGMSIYDTMQYISCPVRTIATGLAASMGAFLLAAGEHGQRMAMPNAEILIHQPLGGMQGQASDLDIAARRMLRTKDKLNRILAKNCGQTLKRVEKDTDRDNWLTAEEALEYGLIDAIVTKKTK